MVYLFLQVFLIVSMLVLLALTSLLIYLKNKMFMIVIIFIAIVQFVLIYYGGELFRTVGLSFKEIEIMLLCAFSVIPVELFRKIYLKKNNKLGHV